MRSSNVEVIQQCLTQIIFVCSDGSDEDLSASIFTVTTKCGKRCPNGKQRAIAHIL